jgi:hypothetical protein
MSEIIRINKLELASALAEREIENQLVGTDEYPNPESLMTEDLGGVWIYKEEVQDKFNELYDYFLSVIEISEV